MAIISSFELLVKRIAPTTGNAVIDAPFRRAVQGYFLTITNPSNRRVNFRMRAVFPLLDPASPSTQIQRELIGGPANQRNHIFTYDITGGSENGQLAYQAMFCRIQSANTANLRSTNLSLDAGQTASFKLLPDITSAAINLGDPQLEIRGYLEIVQISQYIGGQLVSPDPVNLIFTPETRGTFLDNAYPGGINLDFDQIAYSVPTTTGSASMNIPEVEFPFVFCFILPDLDIIFPDQLFLESLDFREDFQGVRYLSDKGNAQLESEVQTLLEKFPKASVDLAAERRSIEQVLNDPNIFLRNDEK